MENKWIVFMFTAVILTVSGQLTNDGSATCEKNNLYCYDTPKHDFREQTFDDCLDAMNKGYRKSGIYTIETKGQVGSPSTKMFKVYCDMDTDGGGWLVFQRRRDGTVGFFRRWVDYKHGFGHLNGEMWLGNDNIHRITAQKLYKLRIELEDWEGNKRYAKYDFLRIGDEWDKYKLHLGTYSGNAGDSLSFHNGQNFSTFDSDNDSHSTRNCAQIYKGAWWYKNCYDSTLNGLYLKGQHQGGVGINWRHFKEDSYSCKFTEMKIRPGN